MSTAPDLPVLPIFETAYKADPYPYYRQWPREPPFWALADGVPAVVAARFRDVDAIYRDHRRFSSVKPAGAGLEKFDFFNGLQDMVHTDPPAHTRLRRIVAPAFLPAAIGRLEQRLQDLADTLLDSVPRAGGEFEVMAQLARPLSVRTMLGLLLDVPAEEYPVFEALSRSIALLADVPAGAPPPSAYTEAWEAGRAYCDRVVAARRKSNQDDVVGRVVDAEQMGALTGDEVLVMLMGLFLGGLSTVATQIGNAFVQLAAHPEQYARLRADPGLAASAAEEVIRYDGAGLFNYKFASEDLEFEGLTIPAGTTVYIIQPAAGFDPTAFDDPFRFDIRRPARRNLAFGSGIHACIGAPLARLALRIVLERAIRIFPKLSLAEGTRIRYGGWQQERAPDAVPLVV